VTAEPLICAYCFGPIHSAPVWRNGRCYHAGAGPIFSKHRGGCAAADKPIMPIRRAARVHPDQLTLEAVQHGRGDAA
jgi:hypothetical protein